jgi:hypothetical protein
MVQLSSFADIAGALLNHKVTGMLPLVFCIHGKTKVLLRTQEFHNRVQ